MGKRFFDIAFAVFFLFLLVPLLLIFMLVVATTSPGGAFFSQVRVGKEGRLFRLLKFRTMRPGSEAQGQLTIGGRDPRITAIGLFLRKTKLDELPQFWNVLMGDMSLVGPRPPIPYEVEAYELWHRKRLDMKPGLTGLWQVSGRNRLPFEEMVRLDLFYIENWSLLLDLKIILRTGFVMLGGEGF